MGPKNLTNSSDLRFLQHAIKSSEKKSAVGSASLPAHNLAKTIVCMACTIDVAGLEKDYRSQRNGISVHGTNTYEVEGGHGSFVVEPLSILPCPETMPPPIRGQSQTHFRLVPSSKYIFLTRRPADVYHPDPMHGCADVPMPTKPCGGYFVGLHRRLRFHEDEEFVEVGSGARPKRHPPIVAHPLLLHMLPVPVV